MSGFNNPSLLLVATDPKNVSITQCVLKRGDRAQIDPDKMATLMLASCSKFESQYDFVSTASLSNDVLAETNYKSTVALDNINQAVKARLRMYDLNSFFEQFPKVSMGTWDPNQETIDLFENLDGIRGFGRTRSWSRTSVGSSSVWISWDGGELLSSR